MDCPSCARRVQAVMQADGTPVYYCKHCGWGNERGLLDPSESERESKPSSIWPKLLLFWLGSLLIIFLPYFLLVHSAFPFNLILEVLDTPKIPPAEMAAKINPWYWIVLVFYLLIGIIFQPDFDITEVRGHLILDLPFTYRDDIARWEVFLGVFFWPARFVGATLHATWQLIRLHQQSANRRHARH